MHTNKCMCVCGCGATWIHIHEDLTKINEVINTKWGKIFRQIE